MKKDVCENKIYSKLLQKKLWASKKKKIGLGKMSNIFFFMKRIKNSEKF